MKKFYSRVGYPYIRTRQIGPFPLLCPNTTVTPRGWLGWARLVVGRHRGVLAVMQIPYDPMPWV